MKSRISAIDNTAAAQNEYEQGKDFLAKNNHKEALECFKKALTLDANHLDSKKGKANVLHSQAQPHVNQQDWQMAEALLNEAHQAWVDDVEIVNQLANVRRRQYLEKTSKQPVVTPNLSAGPPRPRIDNVVFQGGGMKGLGLIGASEVLEQRLDLDKVKRFGGTSAGAINALLMGLGYRGDELKQLLQEIDFKLFMDGDFRDKLLDMVAREEELKAKGEDIMDKFKKVRNARRAPFTASSNASALGSEASRNPDFKNIKEGFALLTQNDFGLFPGDYIREEWMEKLIQAKTGVAYITFKELHDLGFKDIYFVGVNINTGCSEVFSYETTPDVIVSDALRISMSIPLIFKPHQLYTKVDGRRTVVANSAWYVDGGLLDNYPLWLFDKARYWQTNPVLPDAGAANPYTLGLRLNTAAEKSFYEGEGAATESTPTKNLGSFCWSIVSASLNKENSDHLKNQEQSRSIYVDYLDVKTTQFDLNKDKQEALIDSGRQAAIKYFDKRFGKSQEKSPLDEALESQQKPQILALIQQGFHDCQQPDKVEAVLEDAMKSGWFDIQQIKEDLSYFRAYHQQALDRETPSGTMGFF